LAKKERTFVGLYCGPSADGVDAALVTVAGQGEKMKAKQAHFLCLPMPQPLRDRLHKVASGWAGAASDLARLSRDVGALLSRACGAALKAGRVPAKYVSGIGVMGPVAAYVPPTPSEGHGWAIALDSAATVARTMRLPVASGFELSDLSAGGVGGPVWAWPDWLLFRDDRLSRVVVQLGAIASISFVGSAAAACEVVAMDTGPGTILIDAITQRLFDRPMDEDGAIAARGKVNEALLNELLAGEYFHRAPPKRTHWADWSGAALQRLEIMAGKHRSQAVDLMATVTELTARTVARDVLARTERPHEVILAGGGAKNIHLAGRIRHLLSPCSTYAAERYGLDVRAHGAVCCAVLAAARLDEFPAHCHAASGAEEPVVLGALWVP